MLDLEARKKGIGGSDIAAVLGVSAWSSPLKVWLEKTGRKEPDPENELTHFGKVMEPLIAKEFELRNPGKKVFRVNRQIVHRTKSHFIANIDRAIAPEGKLAVLKGEFRTDEMLECKNVGAFAFRSDSWEDGMPEYYEAQCRHYLGVTGLKRCYLAALIGGNSYVQYLVEHDEDILGAMWDAAEKFWRDYVVKDVQPPFRNEADVSRIFKRSAPKAITGDGSILMAFSKYVKASQERKEAEEKESELKSVICAFMGEADTLLGMEEKVLATWKSAKDSKKTDWQAVAESVERILRRKFPDLNPKTIQGILKKNTTIKPGARTFRAKGE